GHARVVVRAPEAARLVPPLTAAGAVVAADGPGLLTVTGLAAAEVGELAFRHHVVLHELTARHASLEEAFMELTADHAQYRTDAHPALRAEAHGALGADAHAALRAEAHAAPRAEAHHAPRAEAHRAPRAGEAR
ncbi:hypothetical protein DZF91_24390, partial [Actinomadura logoneensis]